MGQRMNALEHGEVFGKLTVLRKLESKERGPRYVCGCVCGYKGVMASAKQLMRGKVKSCLKCATERSTDDENNTHWGFMFPDGSVWTDDLFPFKEAAERFLNTPDAQFVEGAKLVELVIRRVDRNTRNP